MDFGRGILTEKCGERGPSRARIGNGSGYVCDLLQRLEPSAQAGLVAAGRVLVQYALLNGFIQGRYRFAEALFGGRLIALSEGRAHITQGRAQTRGVAAVPRSAAFSLTSALQRRKMICHCGDAFGSVLSQGAQQRTFLWTGISYFTGVSCSRSICSRGYTY